MSTKRIIFEEVGSVDQSPAAQPGMIDKGRDGARGAIRVWLVGLPASQTAALALQNGARLLAQFHL